MDKSDCPNRRANQLAHYMRKLGVKPGTLVGICVERSLEMIVGTVGILKAGGAYVPLETTYPQERLNFMIQDTQTPVLLIQEHLRPRLPECEAQVVCIDADWDAIAQESQGRGDENPVSGTAAGHLAYVMYTSGSTGWPKGVSVVHRGVVRLVQGTNFADLSAQQVFMQLAPISFDAATLEIWGPLLNGGRLVVLPGHTPSLAEIGQALARYRVTTLWLTASLFHLMVDERFEELGGLRQLLAGGDVLSVAHVRRVVEALDGVKMINGYGPTENTTFSTCYPVLDPGGIVKTVPIGYPIANTRVYVLDARLQPVPVGVPGELYVGGDGLARGYLNQPALTAERFVPHPFDDEPGARLYTTGDVVRFLPDGSIEFLGRGGLAGQGAGLSHRIGRDPDGAGGASGGARGSRHRCTDSRR
jgi:amino acid adenylation domain-containing protein